MSKRIYRSAQQWQVIIDDQASSGHSTLQYCQDQGISYPVFCKWRKKLLEQDATESTSLIDLSGLITRPHQPSWDIELDLGEGIALRFRRG